MLAAPLPLEEGPACLSLLEIEMFDELETETDDKFVFQKIRIHTYILQVKSHVEDDGDSDCMRYPGNDCSMALI